MSRASVESLRAYLENLKQKYLVPFERELAAIESLAKGAQQSVSYMDYESMISAVTVLAKGHYNIGQNVLIVTLNVPDLWVSGILEEFTPFVYVSDEQFVLELNTNGYVDVGYYRLSALETGKVNLPEYVKSTDYATADKAGVVKVGSGLYMGGENKLIVLKAETSEIAKKTNAYKPIVPKTLDYAVKVGITTNTETLTDEEKTSACNWLGAVREQNPKFTDGGATRGYVYFIDANGNQVVKAVQIQASYDTIPLRNYNGNFYVNTPTLPYECTPKGYVDGKIDELVARIESLGG